MINYSRNRFNCAVLCLITQSCPTLCNPVDYRVHGILQARIGVGSLSLLQGIFPNQESNPGLPHCGWILYQLSHKGSPRILEWVAYPFPSRSSWPRNQTGVSCIAGGFFTNWTIREAEFTVTLHPLFPFLSLFVYFIFYTVTRSV